MRKQLSATLRIQAKEVKWTGEGSGNPLQYSCLENPMDGGAWWAAVHGVVKSWARLSGFPFSFHFHALEKEMATHSSVLAWRILGTTEPGGLPSMGSHRVRHDWLADGISALIFTGGVSWGKAAKSFHYEVSQLPNEVTTIHLTGLCVDQMKYWRAGSKRESFPIYPGESRTDEIQCYNTHVCHTGQKRDVNMLCVG